MSEKNEKKSGKMTAIVIAVLLLVILVVVVLLLLKGCDKDPAGGEHSGNASQSQSGDGSGGTGDPGNNHNAPEGAVIDETKLGESVTYSADGEYLYLKVKTSYEFDAHQANIDIVNPGFYLTRNSELITQEIYSEIRAFDDDFDKEWFDGIYVFKLDNNVITGLASDGSQWAPGTWTMMLYEGESGLVIGQWFIVLEGGGKFHFEFKDSWLRGAGEDRKVETFDSLEKEVESWFTFRDVDSNDEWATFDFDGYYLEETDPQGYDKYYMMVCPEGDYTTYADADAVDLTYCAPGGVDYAKCPYRFAFEQGGIEPGKYTMVLAKMGGNVEVQFSVEKIGPKDWKMDFTNAKYPRLESKYAK